MKPEPNEILSAFLDGEAVEERVLAEALAAPGGREMLVDFVLLRGAVASSADRPSRKFYERMDSILEPRRKERSWRAVTAAAAVAMIVFVALGVWSFRPTETMDVGDPQPVPEATRTLRFERGVNWEGKG